MQKKIPTLKSGDEIRIVSPASFVERSYIENTIQSLEAIGYKVSLGDNLYSEFNQFAGTDKQRSSDFQHALDDKNVRAIFCARGGYGSVRIIDSLNFQQFKESPKWIVGFSDITVFHSLVNESLGLPTIHAPMPVNFSSPWFSQNLEQLNLLLQGESKLIELKAEPLNNFGIAKGKLVGGNLSILYSLQGTPYSVDTHGKVLFIEDVGEQLYHLDRMLNNFRLAGNFEGLKGIIVGGLSSMEDKKRPFGKSAEEIIKEYLRDLRIPAVFNFPAGHIENNQSFVLGSEIELCVEEYKTILKYC